MNARKTNLVNGKFGFAMGISAMPSMHNAISFLYVMAARRAKLPLRIAAVVFAGLVLVASVHLGWHYAIDGLVAWASMGTIWWAVDGYLRKIGYDERIAPGPQAIPATAGA